MPRLLNFRPLPWPPAMSENPLQSVFQTFQKISLSLQTHFSQLVASRPNSSNHNISPLFSISNTNTNTESTLPESSQSHLKVPFFPWFSIIWTPFQFKVIPFFCFVNFSCMIVSTELGLIMFTKCLMNVLNEVLWICCSIITLFIAVSLVLVYWIFFWL